MKSMPMIKAMAIAAHEGRKTNTRRTGEPCKYNVGDICYIQEEYYQFGHWKPVEGVKTKGGRKKWKFVPYSESIKFETPSLFRSSMDRDNPERPHWYKRLGRFMPEKYSRTKIEVIAKTRELLQDISEEDAIAEGVSSASKNGGLTTRYAAPSSIAPGDRWEEFHLSARDAFRDLWESINGPDSWNANPQVWRIEFRRVKP